jgi:iron-sulfur cluster assembly accessory protein
MNHPVEVTTSAAGYISDMIKREGKKHVMLELVDGGCNGYEYRWTTTNEEIGDFAIRLNQENMLYLNKSTAEKMYASMIVMEKNGLNNKLTIVNPNIKGSCGCGLSVNF